MFPTLYNSMKTLLPEAYFGGQEVPPYCHADIEINPSVGNLVRAIRTIGGGSNSSGYIDEEGIHFHLPTEDEIFVDLSKRYIFVSEPNASGSKQPSAWQIFSFLREPVHQALFVAQDRAILVEKTEGTLDLCRTLDRLWAEERFLGIMEEMVESQGARDRGLACLMKAYEQDKFGSSTEMWEFWESFANFLMTRNLELRVESFL